MRSFKSFLVLGLMILLIGFSSGCDMLKKLNPFGPDIDDELKFATNVEVTYERTESYVSTEYYDSHVNLNINPAEVIEDWQTIQNTEMEKISDQQFKYVVGELPADVRLYVYVQDWGKSNAGGNEFNARKIIVNGTELTDIRDDPWGNSYQVAYFTIKENGAVVP